MLHGPLSTGCDSARSLFLWVFHGLQPPGHIHHGLLHRGICAQLLEHFLPTFPFTGNGVCRALSLVFFSLLFLTSAIQWFSSFLKIYSHRGATTVFDGSALVSGGSVLEPAGTGWKQAPGFFS